MLCASFSIVPDGSPPQDKRRSCCEVNATSLLGDSYIAPYNPCCLDLSSFASKWLFFIVQQLKCFPQLKYKVVLLYFVLGVIEGAYKAGRMTGLKYDIVFCPGFAHREVRPDSVRGGSVTGLFKHWILT